MNRFLIAAAALLAATAASAADLTLEVRGRPAGAVYAALYDSADGWLQPGRAVKMAMIPAGEAPRFVFKDLPPGRYAVSLYDDANGNGKLDRNAIGSPMERWAVSRDAKGRMGPPSFDDAAVELQADHAQVQATLP